MPFRIPLRAGVALQIFCATFVIYMLRVNLAIAILAMVEVTIMEKNATSECINQKTRQSQELPDYGRRYNWSNDVKSYVLGAYFYGYLITCIPGGILSERYGPTRVTFISSAVSAVLTILTPVCAQLHYGVVFANRFILGLCSGVIYPALHCIISRWAPPDEKGKFVASLLGNNMGTIVTWPMLGVIIHGIGWVWAFYISGIIGVVWCVTWWLVVSDYPDSHPWIREEEKEYITSSLQGNLTKKKQIPPYLKVFISVPFWALCIGHYGNLWGLYLLLTNGPMYMADGLGFNIRESGGLASLPYLCRMIFGIGFGELGDFLRHRRQWSTTIVRKGFTVVSHVIPGLLLCATVFIGCNAPAAVALVTLSMGLNGASTITTLQNSQDLAPNFAGTIFGIINCIGGTSGFLSPIVYAKFTQTYWGLRGFHYTFITGGVIYMACGIMFIIFGSGEKQSFNEAGYSRTTEEPASEVPE